MFPPDVANRMVSSAAGEDVPADPTELGWLVGLTGGRTLSDELTIDGWWKSRDDLDVSADSVLVVPELAETVAFTVLTVEPFHRWLPRESDLSMRFRRRLPLRRLFHESEDRERRLDRHDPYASPTALRRPAVARVTTKILGLHVADPFGRTWRDSGDTGVFRNDAWGVEREGPDGDAGRSGNRLRIRAASLLDFLRSTGRWLVLLVKVQKYVKDDDRRPVRRTRRGERYIPFRTQTLVAIISPEKHVRLVRVIPRSVRDAVKNISESDRHDFGERLIAIARVHTAKTPKARRH